MRHLWLLLILTLASPAFGMTQAEDIATTIILRGYSCPGRTVSDIEEIDRPSGEKVIRATCPNGRRYQITVSPEGRLTVKPVR